MKISCEWGPHGRSSVDFEVAELIQESKFESWQQQCGNFKSPWLTSSTWASGSLVWAWGRGSCLLVQNIMWMGFRSSRVQKWWCIFLFSSLLMRTGIICWYIYIYLLICWYIFLPNKMEKKKKQSLSTLPYTLRPISTRNFHNRFIYFWNNFHNQMGT